MAGRSPPTKSAQNGAEPRNWDLESEQRAWQTRRVNAQDVSSYSRFVGLMKIILPAVATLLLALVLLYSLGGRGNENVTVSMTAIGSQANDKQMVKPRLTGTDGRGQPFTVTASAVGQDLGDHPKMTLFDIEGDITMENKNWMKIEARTGVLDGKAKMMTMQGAINIYSDLGYECHTDAAIYDMAKGLLTGKRPINCQGPLGDIYGNGFEGLHKAEQLKLTGGVKTTFYPPPRKTPEAATPAPIPPANETTPP